MVASHLAMTDGSASLRGSWPEHGRPSAFAAGRTSPAGSCSNSNCGSVSESCVRVVSERLPRLRIAMGCVNREDVAKK